MISNYCKYNKNSVDNKDYAICFFQYVILTKLLCPLNISLLIISYIQYIYVSGIFPNKNIEPNDDEFHYYRTIGGETVESNKMIFGFKDKELKEKIEKDFLLVLLKKLKQ